MAEKGCKLKSNYELVVCSSWLHGARLKAAAVRLLFTERRGSRTAETFRVHPGQMCIKEKYS